MMDVLVDVDDIRSGIPRYVEMMLDYADDPPNKEEMRCFILDRLEDPGQRTADLVDRPLSARDFRARSFYLRPRAIPGNVFPALPRSILLRPCGDMSGHTCGA